MEKLRWNWGSLIVIGNLDHSLGGCRSVDAFSKTNVRKYGYILFDKTKREFVLETSSTRRDSKNEKSESSTPTSTLSVCAELLNVNTEQTSITMVIINNFKTYHTDEKYNASLGSLLVHEICQQIRTAKQQNKDTQVIVSSTTKFLDNSLSFQKVYYFALDPSSSKDNKNSSPLINDLPNDAKDTYVHVSNPEAIRSGDSLLSLFLLLLSIAQIQTTVLVTPGKQFSNEVSVSADPKQDSARRLAQSLQPLLRMCFSQATLKEVTLHHERQQLKLEKEANQSSKQGGQELSMFT